MPEPKRIDTRKVWDRTALDLAFDGLPGDEDTNPWDVVAVGQQVARIRANDSP